jgi:hypothetical protein
LFAFSADVSILLIAQLLGGISAAAVTVLTILVITDLTTGTGRFNLVRGSVGTLIAIAASISTTATGLNFPGTRPLGRFSDPGGRFRHCDRVAMGGNAGDNAG